VLALERCQALNAEFGGFFDGPLEAWPFDEGEGQGDLESPHCLSLDMF